MLAGADFETHLRTDYLCNRRNLEVNSSCLDSFASFIQPFQKPTETSLCFQGNMGYYVNDNDVFASNYSWRNYYSDLAFKFSQSTYSYSKPCCDLVNIENCIPMKKTFIQQECPTLDCSNNSREFLRNSTNDRIWRPFSPTSSDTDISPIAEADGFGERNQNLTMLQNNSINTVSLGGKLDHSNLSVFVPVKRKTQSCSSPVFYENLQSHALLQLKSGSKPYVCDYPKCFKSFARNEELTRHKRIHSGFKPHQCTACGKSFGRKDHLSKHLKTHLEASEKKVYVCCISGCGHRYTRSDALTRHKTTAHSISKSRKPTKTLKHEKEEYY